MAKTESLCVRVDVKLPDEKPLSYGNLTEAEFEAIIENGSNQVKNGQVVSAKQVKENLQKYDNAKKQQQTPFEQICNNIKQGHITVTTIQRCYDFDYEKANQIMNELIKNGFVRKVDANYEIISKDGLMNYFSKFGN